MGVSVRVPASSANIGPGYDSLGMALSLHSTFYAEPAEKLVIEGCPEAFRNEDNLVYQAFCRVYEKAGIAVPGVRLVIDSHVPVARGLGSSSTCFAGGAALANALLGDPFSKDDLFQICTALEGHPDNAAPALFGGLTASFMNEGRAMTVPFSPDPDWRFATFIPDYEVRTSEARRIVKKEIPLSAAVHTMSHAVAMILGLETGDEALVRAACDDVLHEPYRRTLIREYDGLRELTLGAGAAAFFISGSGSTLIAATRSAELAETLCARGRERFPNVNALVLTLCREGTVVSGT